MCDFRFRCLDRRRVDAIVAVIDGRLRGGVRDHSMRIAGCIELIYALVHQPELSRMAVVGGSNSLYGLAIRRLESSSMRCRYARSASDENLVRHG